MRYNAEIQKKADAYAKKHGYFCAVYLGPTDSCVVFKPREEDNEPRCTGLPTFIVYRNNRFRLDRGLNFCKYAKELRYTHPSEAHLMEGPLDRKWKHYPCYCRNYSEKIANFAEPQPGLDSLNLVSTPFRIKV